LTTEREFFIGRWAGEMPLTLGVIQALPDAKLDYRPHEKCRTAPSIVSHLLGHVEDLNELATANGAIHHRMELPFKNITECRPPFAGDTFGPAGYGSSTRFR
jgi:hypothetical protein